MPFPAPVRVVVSSDLPLVALGIRAAFSQAGVTARLDCFVLAAGWAHRGADLSILADERLTPETLERLGAGAWPQPVLVLTAEVSPALEAALIRAGACSMLPLDSTAEQTMRVVRDLLAGRPRVSIDAIRLLGNASEGTRFTLRQREILRLLADGHGAAEIARRLGIAQSTVKTHLGRLGARLGVDSRAELASAAQFLLASADPA